MSVYPRCISSKNIYGTLISLLFACIIITSCSSSGAGSSSDTSSGDSGTDEYVAIGPVEQISSAEELLAITDLSANFILTGDIDFTDIDLSDFSSPLFAASSFDDSAEFTGNFNGNGYSISFDDDAEEEGQGLFINIGTEGIIQNVKIYNVKISGDSYIGGITAKNEGVITDCIVSGTINGEDYLGGIAGENSGTISECSVYVSINGSDKLGGISGSNSGILKNCSNHMDITSLDGSYIGGISGTNTEGEITGCSSYGEISGYRYVGGIAGYVRTTINGMEIDQCTTSGNIFGDDWVGGLVGYLANTSSEISTYIANSSSSAYVEGETFVGGLVGFCSDVEIYNCNASGEVLGTERNIGGLIGYVGDLSDTGGIHECWATGDVSMVSSANEIDNVGGLVGTIDYGTISNCFASGNVRSDAEIERSLTLYGTGGLVGSNMHGIIENCFADGMVSGTSYVGGLVGLQKGYDGAIISECWATGEVTGDSQVGGLVGWNGSTIEYSWASGDVFGGYAVGGLAGYTTENSYIDNCHAEGTVEGTDTYTGGLIGREYDSNNTDVNFQFSYATGFVTGVSGVGGFIGDSRSTGEIKYCYALGDVESNETAGGFAGSSKNIISDCYATGQVTAMEEDTFVAGFLAYFSQGSIACCYSSGMVNFSGDGDKVGGFLGYVYPGFSGDLDFEDCFYDSMVNSDAACDNGLGEPASTEELQGTSIFTNWDTSVWMLGSGYPYLKELAE